jgi:hypothetical protein
VSVDYRLLKLKAELINLLLLLPRHLVDYQLEFEEVARENDSLDRSDCLSTRNSMRRMFIEKFTEHTGAPLEAFLSVIQQASSPQELLDCVIFLERSIHPSVFVGFKQSYLPKLAVSAASVAVYLFALDRAIRYEDINSLNMPCDGDYKPRIQFVPRCIVQSTCSKPSCHGGKCSNTFESTFSRFQDVSESAAELRVALMQPLYCTPVPLTITSYSAAVQPQQQAFSRPSIPYKRPAEDHANDAQKRPVIEPSYNYNEIEIENVIPYVPRPHELSSTIWV